MDFRAKMSLFNFVSWSGLFTVFCIVFFSSTQPEVLPLSNYRSSTMVIFALANAINLVILFIMRKREKTDERNIRIESISSSITVISLMIIVAAISLTLHVLYDESGYVSTSWLWFIAYSSVFSVFIISNLSYVIVSLKGLKYEN